MPCSHTPSDPLVFIPISSPKVYNTFHIVLTASVACRLLLFSMLNNDLTALTLCNAPLPSVISSHHHKTLYLFSVLSNCFSVLADPFAEIVFHYLIPHLLYSLLSLSPAWCHISIRIFPLSPFTHTESFKSVQCFFFFLASFIPALCVCFVVTHL